MIITCPTGLSFRARKWNLSDVARATEQMEAEEAALRGEKNNPHSNLLLEMCQAAVVGDIQPGPYKLNAAGGINWVYLTNQDLIAALVQIRRMTKPIVEGDFPCKHCRRLQPEGVHADLSGVDIYTASPAGIEVIQTGVPYELKAPTTAGEAVLRIRPVYARDNQQLAALQREEPTRLLEIANCMSVQEIVLPGGKRLTTLPEIRDFYGQQEWDFLQLLDETVEDLFGGPDTSFTWRCAHTDCAMEQRMSLPLDASFWGLGGRRRKRRKISSASTSPGRATSESSPASSSGSPTLPT